MKFATFVSVALGLASSAAAGVVSTRQNPPAGTYVLVFGATTSVVDPRDAASAGDGYLGFTYIPNSAYNVPACQAFCDSNRLCLFANLYYEYNVSSNPNQTLKCAIYSKVLTASSKTNWGGQQILPLPAPVSYITQSTGWGKADSLPPQPGEGPVVPTNVPGFTLSFDAPAGLVVSDGLMNTINMGVYDSLACGTLCAAQAPLEGFGDCRFFNIVSIKQGGVVQTHMCRLYAKSLNRDTLDVPPTGGTVTFERSRGYARML